MKHAGPKALDRLEPLLERLRRHGGLKEKSRGCFYLGGKGFLHFHEHGKTSSTRISALATRSSACRP